MTRTSSKRTRLVETALELISREGFHATGIDRILETAGVAKATLYKHFHSKEELLLAALRLRDERFRNRFLREVDARGSDPASRLLAAFDVLGDWHREEGFCGCTFLNACAEYADPDHPLHAAAAEHKRLFLSWVEDQARQAGAARPDRLAGQMMMLMEGATVAAQVRGDREAAGQAREAARVLLASALGG